MEDSGVSEENVSSANSTATEQAISNKNGAVDASTKGYHIVQSINNNNLSNSKNRNQPPPASSIVHLSPGGSTVIEYKTTGNLQQKINAINAVTNLTGSTSVGDMISSDHQKNSSTISTPHTHFHKKYIKQMQMSGLSPSGSVTSSTDEASPISSSTRTFTISLNQDYETSPRYSGEHETVIVENDYRIGSHEYERNDDYVTPVASPRQSQQHQSTSLPSTPQKTIYVSNTMSSPSMTSTQSSPNGGVCVSATSPTLQYKSKQTNSLPYDPFIHTNNKPPLSFSSLIFLAIEDAQEKALPVKEIYSWIVHHYPYFKTAPTGWKNSVRHNLSLNKCFQKVEKAPVSFQSICFFSFKFQFYVFVSLMHRIWEKALCGVSNNSTNKI